MKVLIVDDSATLRDQLKKILHKAGMETIEAEHGIQALEILIDHRVKIDFIICDVNMPEMDGLSMLKIAKDIDRAQGIPIFMLTTESTEEYKVIGKACGVKAWVTKPFNGDKLVAAIKKVTGWDTEPK